MTRQPQRWTALPDLDLTLINGVKGDPGLQAFFKRSGERILFDAGSLEALSKRELNRIRQVFITHAHIDHFFGFDRLIRVHIPHHRKVHVFGPPGMATHVQGKLRGYLWNLVTPGQIRYEVHELHPDRCSPLRLSLQSDDAFALHPLPPLPVPATPFSMAGQGLGCATTDTAPQLLATLSDKSRVYGLLLDHGTPVVGYALRPPPSWSIDAAALERHGLQRGPWLQELQRALRSEDWGARIAWTGNDWSVAELAQMCVGLTEEAPSLAYLTDIAFTAANLARIRALAYPNRVLVCENSFLCRHWERAWRSKHLTTKQTALIAASLGSKHLVPFHVSQIYGDSAAMVCAETAAFFAEFTRCSPATLARLIAEEEARLCNSAS